MRNPILNNKFMSQETVIEGEPLTINGTIQKTFCLFLILLLGASYTWSLFAKGFLAEVMTYSMVAGFVALLTALIIIFGRVIFLIPVYALAEGVLLGSLSALAEAQYPGIVFNAVLGTFGALFSMLFLYRMKLITCTEKFKSVVFISTTTIFLIYILDLVGSFFGYKVPFLYDCGVVGIAASLIIIIVAALNLIIDFDFIEKGAQNLIPKKFEWFGAFGLLVTLVWLYIEILKLLSKLNSRR